MQRSKRTKASQSAGRGQGAGVNGPLKFTSNQSKRACCKVVVVDSGLEQRTKARYRIVSEKKEKGDGPE